MPSAMTRLPIKRNICVDAVGTLLGSVPGFLAQCPAPFDTFAEL